VLKRSVKRPRIEDSDRIFWTLLRRRLAEWRDCLHFLKPDTVVRWHRKGWRHYWQRKSKPKQPGQPPISFRLIHDVAPSTVAKYMLRHRSSAGLADLHQEPHAGDRCM
jgi:hypothetical protein